MFRRSVTDLIWRGAFAAAKGFLVLVLAEEVSGAAGQEASVVSPPPASNVTDHSASKAAGSEPGRLSDRTNWWSFQPATLPVIPVVNSALGSTRNPIDNFVFAKLAELKLHPSPEADRRTLLRRVTFDLTGLPPTPEQIDQFVADPASDAYEKRVDQLLASPRYGERWARHWLDVVHFGETHGYDKDKLRPNAWPYRDYVIQAFNQDKAYSRFIEEQLAGDVLFPDEPDGIVALGFIAAGPWDYVGHVELPISKTDGLIARYNDRDDMVMTAISTFQSLTVHCARCHDHKFDPIAQKDYYALQAVFAGVDRAERPYDADPVTHRKRRGLLAAKSMLAAKKEALERAKAKVSSPELEQLDSQLASLKSQLQPELKESKSPSNGYHSQIESAQDRIKWVQVDLGQSLNLQRIRLVPARPTDFADTSGFGFPVRFKIELSEEATFDHAVIVADHSMEDFPNPGDAGPAFDLSGTPARFIRVTATRLWERTKDYVFALAELQAFAGGTNLAREGIVTAQDSIEDGRWSKKSLVDGYSSRERLNDTLPTAAELARRNSIAGDLAALSTQRDRIFEALLDPALKTELEAVQAQQTNVERDLAALPAERVVYAATHEFKPEGSFVPPNGIRPVHLLARGDVKRAGETVSPGALWAVPGPRWEYQPSDGKDEGAGRLALARWITDSRNMLTRRSIVNRVWQYHFGRGLVETPNDFGHMGALPTHPELLDWLAYWFLQHGESFKKLHKLLVTSATYCQSSANDPEAARIDGDNRFLWRMYRARLDAECIRDSILLVSGRLDLRMGGPGDRQFYFKDDHSPVYDYTRFDVDSPEARRRSIYRHIVRSVPDPFMDCLDTADPSQLMARRYTTLTALQALATLNNPFVLRQCEHAAQRFSSQAGSVEQQTELACRWILGRRPTSQEADRFAGYVKHQGMASLCRVLFNTTEFVFVD